MPFCGERGSLLGTIEGAALKHMLMPVLGIEGEKPCWPTWPAGSDGVGSDAHEAVEGDAAHLPS